MCIKVLLEASGHRTLQSNSVYQQPERLGQHPCQSLLRINSITTLAGTPSATASCSLSPGGTRAKKTKQSKNIIRNFLQSGQQPEDVIFHLTDSAGVRQYGAGQCSSGESFSKKQKILKTSLNSLVHKKPRSLPGASLEPTNNQATVTKCLILSILTQEWQ